MRKLSLFAASIALLSAQAVAQVRPSDCRPVFPVVDQTAQVLPDVVTEQAPPPVVAKRGFAGLGLLLPALFGSGLIGAIALSSGHSNNNNNNNTVSPA